MYKFKSREKTKKRVLYNTRNQDTNINPYLLTCLIKSVELTYRRSV